MSEVRERAAKDFGCRSDEIEVTRASVDLTPGAPPSEALYDAKGCGTVRQYWVNGSVVKVHEGEFYMPDAVKQKPNR